MKFLAKFLSPKYNVITGERKFGTLFSSEFSALVKPNKIKLYLKKRRKFALYNIDTFEKYPKNQWLIFELHISKSGKPILITDAVNHGYYYLRYQFIESTLIMPKNCIILKDLCYIFESEQFFSFCG